MKKIFSLSAIILIGFTSFAQNTVPKSNSKQKNNLDTMPRSNNLPSDTATKNQNNKQRPDSMNTGATAMFPDSLKADSRSNSYGTNGSMAKDSTSMSHNSYNSDSTLNASSNGNSNSTSIAPTTTSVSTTDSIKAYEKTLTDRVMMKEDKMYMLKDGEATLMETSFKLSSGAVVSTLGTVKYPGGKIITLKNGQFIEIKPPVVETKTKQVEKYKKSTKASVIKKKTKTQSN